MATELKVKTRDNSDGAGKPRIFISYRHVDYEALEPIVNDLLDEQSGFDCAIWYDSNLHPGQRFDEEIRNALNHTNLFVLIVTAHTFEKGSYIVEKEIPYAKQRCIPILPIVVSEFDESEANRVLGGLHCIDKRNGNYSNQLKEYLNSTLLTSEMKSRIKIAKAKEGLSVMTIEETYLIGMGYLLGVDTDVNNEKACELITASAMGGWYEANVQLLHMYRYGQGVKRDYAEASKWGDKAINIAKGAMDADQCFDNAKRLAEIYSEVGELFYEQRNITAANEYFNLQIGTWRNFLELSDNYEARRLLCWALERLGNSLFENKEFDNARKCFEEMQQIAEKLVEERGIDSDIRSLSWSHGWQGMVHEYSGNHATAKEHYILALDFDRKLAEKIQDEQECLDLVESINKIGDMCVYEGDFDKAKTYYDESIKICQSICEKYKTYRSTIDLAVCYDNLGLVANKKNEKDIALEMYMSALRLRETLVQKHNTVEARSLLALSYSLIGEISDRKHLTEAKKIYEELFTETGLAAYKEKAAQINAPKAPTKRKTLVPALICGIAALLVAALALQFSGVFDILKWLTGLFS